MRHKNPIAEKSGPILISLLLAFAPIALLSKVLFSHGCLFGSDFALYFFPVKQFIRHSITTRGALPFWNPFQFSGTPFIANIQAAMFYPPGFLFYLMRADHAYVWTVILHCLLGSASMYAFVRDLNIKPAGALLAALVFMFNGYFMAHLYAGHLTLVQNYVWLPLILLFLNRFFKTGRFIWTVWAGLFLGIQILGGFPQVAFYTILAVAGFSLFRIPSAFKTSRRQGLRGILGPAVVLGVGFLLAAVQLLPTLELTARSGRAGGVGYAFATMDSLHPKMLFSFLVPDLFGSPVDQTFYLSPRDWYFWETCAYAGILPLVLALIGTVRFERAGPVRWFFPVLALGALFLAFGKYNPIYPLVFKLPGFHHFRIPAQILYLYVFAIAVMSGVGIHRLGNCSVSMLRLLSFSLLGVGAVLVFLLGAMLLEPYGFFSRLFTLAAQEPVGTAIVSRLPEKLTLVFSRTGAAVFCTALLLLILQKKKIAVRAVEIAALALVVVDLGSYAVAFVKPYGYAVPPEKRALVQTLKNATSSGRAMVTGHDWQLNDGTLYRFASIDGYDPLLLRSMMTYLQASQGLPPDRQVITTGFLKNHRAKLLRLLNLKYRVANRRLIEIPGALPRAFLVEKALYVPAPRVLETMAKEDFDPRSVVVFESKQPRFESPADGGAEFRGDCRITDYDYEHISLNAWCNRACYLVLSEIAYPGWRARVDGKRVPIRRGDYLFRVIALDKGEHRIAMDFVSQPFRIGLGISVVTLIASFAALLWGSGRRRKAIAQKG